MMKQACDILIEDLKRLHEVLRRRAAEFKYTLYDRSYTWYSW